MVSHPRLTFAFALQMRFYRRPIPDTQFDLLRCLEHAPEPMQLPRACGDDLCFAFMRGSASFRLSLCGTQDQ